MAFAGEQLRADREKERAAAIRNGLLADPNKRTRLEDAITVVGTCQDMCPQFERIQRIREQAVERPEKVKEITLYNCHYAEIQRRLLYHLGQKCRAKSLW